MKTFKINASYMTYVYTTIEAESEEQARKIAIEMDGADFKQTSLGDWNIDQIIEEV